MAEAKPHEKAETSTIPIEREVTIRTWRVDFTGERIGR